MTIKNGLQRFTEQTQINEVMAVTNVFSHEARLHSYGLLAQVMPPLPRAVSAGPTFS